MRAFVSVVAMIVVCLVGGATAALATTSSDDATTRAIATTMANGDGPRAARLIAASGFATQPQKLGHTIYEGGLLAVSQGTGSQFRNAVAYGFTRGGVSISNASLTFQAAATEVVLAGLTVDEALVGGPTVAQTYEAYAACTLGCPS